MSTVSPEEVLFCGIGTSVVSWYRTGMPALELNCDWFGVVGEPPSLTVKGAISRTGNTIEWERYKTVVLQQPRGRAWLNRILGLRQQGVKVLYEIDDYMHGVRKLRDHEASVVYDKDRVAEHELCMRACDGLIVSTEFLAKRYRKFNKNVYVCRNGVEIRRLAGYELPSRPTVNIGWAGGPGHREAVDRWLPAIRRVLEERPQTRFVTLGKSYADLVDMPGRTISLPGVPMECFHAALCNFDIAIGPAGRSNFYRGKSDLRWIETGALGIPMVGDPFVYNEIRDGEDGLCASTSDEAYAAILRLVDDIELRWEIGSRVKARVAEERSMAMVAGDWADVFLDSLLAPCAETTPSSSSSALPVF